MPRIGYIEEASKTPQIRAMIESAEKTGAPDPRVVSIMTRSEVGAAWVECWNKTLYKGVLPHKLKEMCRIKISVAHQCGYCSTVRSNLAKAEGLTEDMIGALLGDYYTSKYFTAREKAAVLSFVMEGLHPHDIGTVLGRQGIAVRTGHHCAQPVMDWFHVPATTRASLAFYNTTAEIDALAKGLAKVKEIFS